MKGTAGCRVAKVLSGLSGAARFQNLTQGTARLEVVAASAPPAVPPLLHKGANGQEVTLIVLAGALSTAE
ncbi:hypothetical protein E2C01_087183 [Portunus trituberculatus]|uniref:Uncharacterized protein n=1 Tax=Portunus trituberculatus TaxID=210409 RepID=A0A5B7J2N6_PORTR|nr:hypothetical protein [Portunus trituberculatus]